MIRLRYTVKIIITILISFETALLFAAEKGITPDYAREQRWADEITPAIIVGDPIYLRQENQHEFLGIYAAADNATTGLIIAHGMGLHPDWGMISTIRQELNEYGYSTLSIQMPVLAADAGYELYPGLFSEAAERLQVAVDYLKQKGYKRIAIISHSNGSRMTRVYMIENPGQVNAWVALSLTQGDNYEGINVPVLDLYGEHDLPHVLSAKTKREISLQVNALSRQQVISGADHFFAGHEEEMIAAVKVFLNALP